MKNPATQNKRNRQRAQREKKEAKVERREVRKSRQEELKSLRESGVDPDLAGIYPGPQPKLEG